MRYDAKKVAFISSYLPRRCGIATFASDLINNVSGAGGQEFEPVVIAMQSGAELEYESPVKLKIRKDFKHDYFSAADYINFSNIDLLSVQHEFGLFGGEAGSYLSVLLERVRKPIITTLHTVLEKPSPEYFDSTIDVCRASNKIIVMNRRGISMLQDIYGVPEEKIELIPHGIPDLPFVDSEHYKHSLGLAGRKTILTFGLLGRNKGIEVMLKALPRIVEADPSVLYIVLGATHPEVLRHEGQSYKFELEEMVRELGLQENVVFYNPQRAADQRHAGLCGGHGKSRSVNSLLGRPGAAGTRPRQVGSIRRLRTHGPDNRQNPRQAFTFVHHEAARVRVWKVDDLAKGRTVLLEAFQRGSSVGSADFETNCNSPPLEGT
jgi:glycosyltransferase involved in cell wall biosynthesis